MQNETSNGAQPRVFVAHEAIRPFDMTPAENHGQIVYVFDSAYRAAPNANRIYLDAMTRFGELGFDPTLDLFVTAGGDPLVNTVAAMALGEYLDEAGGAFFSILRYERGRDSEDNYYVPVRITL